MQKYKDGETVYVGDVKYQIDHYTEEGFWNPETLSVDIPAYVLVESTKEYFYSPSRVPFEVEKVHHLPLTERVRRIEEKLGLNDE